MLCLPGFRGHTQIPRICHTFVPSLLVSGAFSPKVPTFHGKRETCQIVPVLLGNGPNTISGSTEPTNTELSEFFWAHRARGSELSEFLLAYYLCANGNSPSFSQNSPSLLQNSVSSLFRNSTLETAFRPFPICPPTGWRFVSTDIPIIALACLVLWSSLGGDL